MKRTLLLAVSLVFVLSTALAFEKPQTKEREKPKTTREKFKSFANDAASRKESKKLELQKHFEALSARAQSKDNPDYRISEFIQMYWNEETEAYDTAYRNTLSYYDFQWVNEIIEEYYVDNTYFPTSKTKNIYDAHWRIIEQQYYFTEAGDKNWILGSKEVTQYDDFGNMTLEAYLSWNFELQTFDTSWAEKTIYEYNSFNKIQRQTSWYYSGWEAMWYPSNRDSFEYDENQFVISAIYEYAQMNGGGDKDDFEWVLNYKEDYTVNENGYWTEVVFSEYYDGEWLALERAIEIEWHSFEEFFPSYYIMQAVDFESGKEWINVFKFEASFFSYLKPLKVSYSEWNEEWVEMARELYEYDEFGNETSFSYEEKEGDDWVIYSAGRMTYEYDENNNYISMEMLYYDSWEGEWLNAGKRLFNWELSVNLPVIANPLQLGVYPNPTRDLLQVQLPAIQSNALLEVFDVQGRHVMKQVVADVNASKISLDVSALPAGLYVVRVGAHAQKFLKK